MIAKARARLLETITVDDESLRLLAQERGEHIRMYLVDGGGISGQRVSLTQVKIEEAFNGNHAQINLDLAAR